MEEYIENWSEVAQNHMKEFGIPASITLAQGILESAYGTSDLAQKANNHFGIKCHDWKGKKVYKDDDEKNECFRKYKSAEESFRDHSLFLAERSRYAFLFELDQKDYSAWADGLQKAGYATHPKYAHKLKDIIERYALYTYDDVENAQLVAARKASDENKRVKNEVHTNPNKTKYVVAKDGDTFYQLAEQNGLTLMQLHSYNDFPSTKDVLQPGDKVYVSPKRRASKKHAKIALSESISLWEVSQEYGVKLKRLVKLNNTSLPENLINKGEVVQLR